MPDLLEAGTPDMYTVVPFFAGRIIHLSILSLSRTRGGCLSEAFVQTDITGSKQSPQAGPQAASGPWLMDRAGHRFCIQYHCTLDPCDARKLWETTRVHPWFSYSPPTP